MKIDISVRSSNPNVHSKIAEAEIADGITIHRKKILREMVNPPIDYLVFIGANIAVPIAVNLIARFLYEVLKGEKDNKLTINNKPIAINAEKIEQLIISIEKEEKE
jgi:hypothetical protein